MIKERCVDHLSEYISAFYCGKKSFKLPASISLPNLGEEENSYGTKNIYCEYEVITKGAVEVELNFTKFVSF